MLTGDFTVVNSISESIIVSQIFPNKWFVRSTLVIPCDTHVLRLFLWLSFAGLTLPFLLRCFSHFATNNLRKDFTVHSDGAMRLKSANEITEMEIAAKLYLYSRENLILAVNLSKCQVMHSWHGGSGKVFCLLPKITARTRYLWTSLACPPYSIMGEVR